MLPILYVPTDPLHSLDKVQKISIKDEVTALMTKEHSWSPQQQQTMIDAYRELIQQQIAAEQGA